MNQAIKFQVTAGRKARTGLRVEFWRIDKPVLKVHQFEFPLMLLTCKKTSQFYNSNSKQETLNINYFANKSNASRDLVSGRCNKEM